MASSQVSSASQQTVASRLVDAAKLGQVEIVRDLLRKNPNEIDSLVNGQNALQWASVNGHIDVVQVLLEAGANKETKNENGLSSLHCALVGNRLAAVKMLLEKGADCNSQDNDGDTALNISIRYGHEDIMKLLLSHPKTDISIKNNYGNNALHCAILTNKEINRPEAVKILLEKGAEINSTDNDGNTALHLAVFKEQKEVIEVLTNHPRIDFNIKNKRGSNVLNFAIMIDKEINRPEAVKTLLEKGFDINSTDNKGRTLLHNAIWRDNKEVIELLINHPKIDISIKDNEGYNALHYAIMVEKEINRPEAVKNLLEKGVDINSTDNNGRTPFHSAIWRENKEVIELMINHPKINFSIKDNEGYNALHWAIMVQKEINRPEAVKILLKKGVDINATDNTGSTPLMNATLLGYKDVIEVLINHPDIDLSIKNIYGYNALHRAVLTDREINRPEVFQILLQKGPDVNSVDNDGNTTLHLAVTEGYKDVIELLISRPKIDFSIKNKKGLNALHLAVLEMKEIGRKATVHMMLQKGADINSEDNDGNTTIHNAIYSGCKEVIELLISQPKINFSLKNKYGHNVLHFAIMEEKVVNRSDVIQLLLQYGADLNSVDNDGDTVLNNAIYREYREVIELLINNPKIDFNLKNKKGFNALHFALMAEKIIKRPEIVQLLIQKGADLNSMDNAGNSLLHNAVYLGYKEIIELLINHPNIDFSLKNKNGHNVLHFAIMENEVANRPEIIQRLIQLGADINSVVGNHHENCPTNNENVDENGNTPLHHAVYKGDTEIIELLINHAEIDSSLKNNQGFNVLDCVLRGKNVMNRLEVIKLLLNNGADIDYVDEDGNTPLHNAVSKGDTEVMELLINHPKTDFSLKNLNGFNVLDIALRAENVVNRLEVIKLLLNNEADINYVDKDGNTPLHYAVSKGDTEVIELLINHPKTDISLKNHKGYNVLDIALRAENVVNRPELVQMMIQKGVDVNSMDNDSNTALHYAVYTENKKIMEVLINRPEIDFSLQNKQGYDVLHCAYRGEDTVNRPEIMKMLIEKGAKINSVDLNGDTILHHAVNDNDEKVIELLINHPEIDMSHRNKNGLNALHLAVLRTNTIDRTKVMHQLLQTGIDINSASNTGCTALHHAVHNGDIEAVELLISQPNIDLNLQTEQGFTALHLAVLGKNVVKRLELVQLLIEEGVDINSVDKDGDTPIHIAVHKGETEVTELLIDQPNIDLKLRNYKGFTVLSLAVLRNDLISTELLIDKDPSIINTKDGNGQTALHLAAHSGYDQLVTLLIKKGAKIKVRNLSKQTPLMMAVNEAHSSTTELLVTNGADLNITDQHGNTCIHLAALKHSQADYDSALTIITIVCFLVKKGADVTIKNNQGMTPFDLIRDPKKRKNFKKLVETI